MIGLTRKAVKIGRVMDDLFECFHVKDLSGFKEKFIDLIDNGSEGIFGEFESFFEWIEKLFKLIHSSLGFSLKGTLLVLVFTSDEMGDVIGRGDFGELDGLDVGLMGEPVVDDEFVFHFLNAFGVSTEVVLDVFDGVHFENDELADGLLDGDFAVSFEFCQLFAEF
jgi:hypothetical protein